MRNRALVLIIGAGPTGLTLAYELARRGVPFRIIDQKPQPTQSSNASWIQPRTLEIFDLMGVVDAFLRRGNNCEAMQFYIDGKEACRLPFAGIPSVYPYIIQLPQSETERILTDRLTTLGVKIERGVKLTGVLENKDGVTCNITHANGEIEMLDCDWLVAADGANSTVRELGKVHFAGEDIQEQFIVADATIESGLSKKEVHFFFEQGLIFVAYPLGHDKYRIIANLHLPYVRKLFTEREVKELAQERAHGEYYIKKVEWISPFWVHSKIVKNMRHGRIFLAGDAAHIHSPVGGQGMNTGIQDAFNLGWKLALVVQRKANESLLNTYHEERYPVVHRIVQTTEKITKAVLSENGFIQQLKTFSDSVTEPLSSDIQKYITTLSQCDFWYAPNIAIAKPSHVYTKLPVGSHAPEVLFGKQDCLYRRFRDGKHHLLVFLNQKEASMVVNSLNEPLKTLMADNIVLDIISLKGVSDFPDTILDTDGAIQAAYQITEPGLILIRPDNIIAYTEAGLMGTGLMHFLKHYLV